jgi:PAS domain S-box-containing protein
MGGWEWDLTTGRLRQDEGVRRLFGVPPDQAVEDGSRLARLIHPEDRARRDAAVRHAMSGAGEYRAEFRIRRADTAEERWIAARGRAVRGPSGAVERLIGVNFDVTARVRAEQATRAALAELAAVYNTAPVGLCVLDPEGRYVRINGRMAEINGIAAAAHIGRTVREVVPGIADEAEAVLRRMLQTGEPALGVEIEGDTPARPGIRRVWVENWLPLRDADGRVVGVNIVAEEVTARRAAEAALAASEARMRLAQRAARIGVFDWHVPSGRVVWTEEEECIFGLAPGAFDGTIEGWERRVLPEDLPAIKDAIASAMARREPAMDFAFRARRPDGGVVHVEGSGAFEYDASGSPLRMVGVNIDVTARKTAEEDNARLAAIVTSTSDAVLSIDAESERIVTWNRGAEALFGYSAAEAIGAPAGLLVPPEMPEGDPTGVFRWVRDGHRRVHEHETVRVAKNGERIPVSVTSSRMLGRDGRVLGVATIFRDLRQRRAAEERQALLVRELDHRAKNALAVVQAALRLTPKEDPESYARAVEGRVAALARAHTLLAEGRWEGAGLRELIEGELGVFLPARKPEHDASGGAGGSAAVVGPVVRLRPGAAQAISMAVHELATNATKHGALGVPGGTVSVSWQVHQRAGFFRLRWEERGGPLVSRPPTRWGFGSRVIEATVKDQLGGRVERFWDSGGLICECDVPLARALAGRATTPQAPSG